LPLPTLCFSAAKNSITLFQVFHSVTLLSVLLHTAFIRAPLVLGVLKNAIDWASRSYDGSPSPFSGKPAVTVGAGGHAGAARSALAMLPILKELGCVHMSKPELQIQRCHHCLKIENNISNSSRLIVLARWGPGPASFDGNGIGPPYSRTWYWRIVSSLFISADLLQVISYLLSRSSALTKYCRPFLEAGGCSNI
jgi:hypothetical protein